MCRDGFVCVTKSTDIRLLHTNFRISTHVTDYQSSKNGPYSQKHLFESKVLYKGDYLLTEDSYNDG